MALEPDSADWTTFGLIAPAKLNRRKRAKKEGATAKKPAKAKKSAAQRSSKPDKSSAAEDVALAR